MNQTDFFIIYLACGAPFGVYYFFKNRAQNRSSLLWLKTLLNFLFWIPFALVLLRRSKKLRIPFVKVNKNFSADFNSEKAFYLIQKEIEKVLLKSKLKISIYEFRETIERYIGLAIAIQPEAIKADKLEAEIFRIALKKNSQIGSICLARRNRKRLFFHHSEARKDFLNLVEQLSTFNLDDAEKINLQYLATELAEKLKDTEAQIEIEKIFDGSMQTVSRVNVRKPEKDLWKPEIRKPLAVRQTTLSLQSLKAAAMNLREKD